MLGSFVKKTEVENLMDVCLKPCLHLSSFFVALQGAVYSHVPCTRVISVTAYSVLRKSKMCGSLAKKFARFASFCQAKEAEKSFEKGLNYKKAKHYQNFTHSFTKRGIGPLQFYTPREYYSDTTLNVLFPYDTTPYATS